MKYLKKIFDKFFEHSKIILQTFEYGSKNIYRKFGEYTAHDTFTILFKFSKFENQRTFKKIRKTFQDDSPNKKTRTFEMKKKKNVNILRTFYEYIRAINKNGFLNQN